MQVAGAQISTSTAITRLRTMVAATHPPALSPEVIADLIDQAARPDANGVRPSETGWTPTYDLPAAAAKGWRVKQALAASDTTVSMDGATYNRAEVTANAERMAKHYESMAASYGGSWRTSDVIGNL